MSYRRKVEPLANAEQGRASYRRLADRAAHIYAPAVHILGAVTFIAWYVMGAGWEVALTYAIAVLIITCPCALALAVPAVQIAASSRLFRNGIILKSGDALERLAEPAGPGRGGGLRRHGGRGLCVWSAVGGRGPGGGNAAG